MNSNVQSSLAFILVITYVLLLGLAYYWLEGNIMYLIGAVCTSAGCSTVVIRLLDPIAESKVSSKIRNIIVLSVMCLVLFVSAFVYNKVVVGKEECQPAMEYKALARTLADEVFEEHSLVNKEREITALLNSMDKVTIAAVHREVLRRDSVVFVRQLLEQEKEGCPIREEDIESVFAPAWAYYRERCTLEQLKKKVLPPLMENLSNGINEILDESDESGDDWAKQAFDQLFDRYGINPQTEISLIFKERPAAFGKARKFYTDKVLYKVVEVKESIVRDILYDDTHSFIDILTVQNKP